MFDQADLDLICWTVEQFPGLSRTELAYTVCENIGWHAPNGKERLHSCFGLLEQLHQVGIINAPEKQKQAPHRPRSQRSASLPQRVVQADLRDVRPISVVPVPPEEQSVWDATVATHHPFGFQRAFGAHQRYWIYGHINDEKVILGAFLFAAAARNVTARDTWLGWTDHQQQRFRHRVVSNSRMLILPGVDVKHLASHALSLVVRRLPNDWQERYGYRPIVIETYVTPPWKGTCYRAANWVHLGQTAGTGRQDRNYKDEATIRHIFAYPLLSEWRQALIAEEPTASKKVGAVQGGKAAMIRAEQIATKMTEERIKQRYEALTPFLDEKQRRLFAAAEAISYGTGGVERVAELLKISPTTVSRGVNELRNPETIEVDRIRHPGAGRKPATETDPDLLSDLDSLISPETRGDPESPLRWTCKSTRRLAKELELMKPGRSVSRTLVGKLLHQMGYSLQATQKTMEGKEHPDRDEQFQNINTTAEQYQQRQQPVISVDAKKKELVGTYKNGGREWHPQGQPERAPTHDFPSKELGKASPYGVYDYVRNEGWVSIGVDRDTAAFAVSSIRGWWQQMGKQAYPDATELLITADSGGSNSYRSRLWKVALQQLADETGLNIGVCHYPPGTSKWNKIEHRMFCHITQNWRTQPLVSHEVIVNLIANTTTSKGLKIQCGLDTGTYPTGIKITDEELQAVNIECSDFHGEWNYVIRPRI